MNYISERLNEAAASRRRRLKWEKCKYQRVGVGGGGSGGGVHLDFAFHHSPQLYLLISSSICAAPLADKPATLAMPPQS